MKQYLLFVGANYYPTRWYDFKGSFNTVEEAINEAKIMYAEDVYGPDWFQVVDTEADDDNCLIIDKIF